MPNSTVSFTTKLNAKFSMAAFYQVPFKTFFFHMLATQMLVILLTISYLTIDIGVRVYFRQLVNKK
jgi:hypothetical protein